MEINITKLEDQMISLKACITNLESAKLALAGIHRNRLLYPFDSLFQDDVVKYEKYVTIAQNAIIGQLKLQAIQNYELLNT